MDKEKLYGSLNDLEYLLDNLEDCELTTEQKIINDCLTEISVFMRTLLEGDN